MGVPKLIFGAASFGMNFVNPEDAQEVLDYLKENNIIHLDTAGRYPPTFAWALGGTARRDQSCLSGLHYRH